MAIYLPGVKDYVPQLEVFTPDYKFMSDVLQTRQDRYTSNYKQLNNLYGKVVYADLSRQNNKDARDQYANKLSPKLQQISGLDLSLQENVDAAEGLFRPFYDNDDIVKDLVHTKAFRDEQQLADYYHNSPVAEIREKYWDTGVKGMQYQMEEFVNASPDEALKMPLPRYVPDADFIERARAALANFGGEGKPMAMKDFVFTPDGRWIIEMENGSLLTDQPYIKADGTTGFRNPAKEFILNTLIDDPLVKDAYRVKAYVKAKDYGKEHAQEYGGNEKKAMEAWANNVLGYTNEAASNQLAETEMSLKSANSSVMDWEKYKKINGIIPDSSEDDEFRKKIAELEGLIFVQKKQASRLAVQSSPSVNFDDLMQKAYNAVFAYDIDKDATIAAIQHSSVNASRTPVANPYGVKTQQAMYDAKLKELGFEIEKELIKARGLEARKTAKYENWLEGGGVPTGPDPGWTLDYSMPTAEYQIDETTGEPSIIPAYVKNHKAQELALISRTEAQKYDFVQDYYTTQASLTDGDILNHTYNYQDNDGNFQTKTIGWNKAREYFSKPENLDQLNQLYNTAKLDVENIKTNNPTENGKRSQKRWEDQLHNINTGQTILNSGSERWNNEIIEHYNHFVNSEKGKGYNENINKGYLPIVVNPGEIKDFLKGFDKNVHRPGGEKKLLSKEKYKEIFVQRAEKAGAGITGRQLDATAPMFLKYYKYPERAEWVANSVRKVIDYNAQGKFDEEKALIDAEAMYDSMVKQLEKSMSASPADKFSMKSHILAQPQSGDEGLTNYPGYSAHYDHEYKGTGRGEQMRADALTAEIKKHLLSPGAERTITWGRGVINEIDGDVKLEHDHDAENFLRFVIAATDAKFNKDNKGAGHPSYTVTYAETLSPKGSERVDAETGETKFYAGYTLAADPPFMKSMGKNLAPGATELTEEQEDWNQGTVTVWVPQEKDNSFMKSTNQPQSAVASEIAVEKDGYKRDFSPGGGFQIYSQTEGNKKVYYENVWDYVRNTETNKWEKRPLTAPRIITVSGTAIQKNMLDKYVNNLREKIETLRDVNLDNLKQQEKEKGVN